YSPPLRRYMRMTQYTTINNGTFDKIPPDVQQYFTAGNLVRPLFAADSTGTPEDDVFVRSMDAIRQATSSVQVEMFNVDKPEMVDLLIEQARKGITVQVIMDPPVDDYAAPRKAAI